MSKRTSFLLLLLALAALVPAPASARTKEILDRGWQFLLADEPRASDPAFDDSHWQYVNLPHSFSEPYFRSPDFYVGCGWYRRRLRIASSAIPQQRSLEFEAAFQHAEVWVNGIDVGGHRGGYTGFSLDISKAVKAGDNVIAVRVDNRWDAQLNPRSGEHVFSGGIYRDVYLVTTSPVHVAWYGTFVTTPFVSNDSATLNVNTELENNSPRTEQAILKTAILDPSGHHVAEYETHSDISSGATVALDQHGDLKSPALWSPETPALYTAVSRIFVNGVLQDEYRTPFGIRWFTWTADGGLTFNGKHRYFHGADVHQDHAGWGDAVSNDGARRDVAMVKQAGFDFIRGSHYPHDPAFVDACDQLGLLFWSENSFWGLGGSKGEGYWNAGAYPIYEKDQGPFEASVKRSLEEMIRINRNHPSVLVWSMSNEPFFSEASVMPKVRRLLKELVEETHALDPTRPAAVGGAQRGDIDLIGDVAGYNGDGATLFLHPKVANAVTEYGSAVETRPGTYDPHLDDMAGQPEFPWRGGQAIWSMYDHGSIAGQLGVTGIVDYFRIPKRGWYWYRNALGGIAPPAWPAPGTPSRLSLTSSSPVIEHADGTGDVQLLVTVLDAAGKPISNTPEVALEVVDGPGGFPTGRSITFRNGTDIPILDGQAAIEFRSYFSGQTTLRATSPGLPEARITIVSKDAPAYVAGVTPEFLPGPYVRFIGVQQKGAEEIANILLQRPTGASSSAAQHPSKLASDGDPATFWAADPDATAPAWWQSDLEGVYDVAQATLRFAAPIACTYQIQISHDGRKTWTTVATGTADTATTGNGEILVPLPSGTSTSGLRIVLTPIGNPVARPGQSSMPLGLAEVTLRGRRSMTIF